MPQRQRVSLGDHVTLGLYPLAGRKVQVIIEGLGDGLSGYCGLGRLVEAVKGLCTCRTCAWFQPGETGRYCGNGRGPLGSQPVGPNDRCDDWTEASDER